MSTSSNHNSHVTDEQLDRHADALRNDAVNEDGPSPQALDATLKMLRAESSSSRNSIVNPGRRSFIGRMVAMSTTQRIAATVLITLGALTLYVMFTLFSSLGSSVALADVVDKFKSARTVQYKSTVALPGQPELVLHTLLAEPQRIRNEMHDGTVSILVDQTSIVLDPKTKTAIRTKMTGLEIPAEAKNQSIVDAMRSLGGQKGEPLGEKVIDGVPCVGFRSTVAGRNMTIWANKKTADPVRVEMSVNMGGGDAAFVMSEFVIDAPLDEALFSLDPPDGYTLQEREFVMPKLGKMEEEVADLLRIYADKSGAEFPASLFDWGAFIDMKTSKDGKVDEQLVAKVGAISGTLFASPPDNFGYAGKGVKRGERDKIVFWYRPEKSKPYRAVFGDLRIEEVTADKLPTTQPAKAPATSTPK